MRHAQKHEASTTLRYKMDEETLPQIREAASQTEVLGNELFRQEIEQALGKRVAPRKRGRRQGMGGIDGNHIGLEYDQR